MKAEINSENKAKFFALYWGKRVFGCKHYEESILVTGHAIDYLSVSNCSDYYLELKPLSQISDEDARKILYDSASKFKRASNARLHIDELRAMGYAMNWHGLTVQEMVDAGWIKLT